MPTDENTQSREVVGSLVYIIHAEWDDTASEYTRTALSLLTKDDLTLTIEEEEEELNLASQRRTKRYRTFNTATFEVSSPIDIDLEQLDMIGFVDTDDDGALKFGRGDRTISSDDGEFIEVAYFDDEGQELADAELIHRMADVEAMNPELDLSETPPIVEWEWMIHGDIWMDYDITNDADPNA